MAKKKKFDEALFRGKTVPYSTDILKEVSDPLAIEQVDYLEFYVENARQACFYYTQAFGFKAVAYRGPETGYRNAASYVLEQNEARFVITSPIRDAWDVSSYVNKHSDGVRDISLQVPNCEAFYHQALMNGAKSAEAPTVWEDDQGSIKRAAIKTYGDVIHSIVERKGYNGVFWPGFVPFESLFPSLPEGAPVNLLNIDHIVGNVELGKMDYWTEFYKNILGFEEITHFTDEDISTEYSALMSKVLANGTGKIKFPINEPAEGKRKSQIEEYLTFNNGPGVQHIAMKTKDILHSVPELRKRGINFLKVPKAYYELVPGRVGEINEDFTDIAEHGILVDRDDDGYLLQLFTRPVQDRPTVFFEIIQREGSQGFGKGNFKALFEALELEQDRRGNL